MDIILYMYVYFVHCACMLNSKLPVSAITVISKQALFVILFFFSGLQISYAKCEPTGVQIQCMLNVNLLGCKFRGYALNE